MSQTRRGARWALAVTGLLAALPASASAAPITAATSPVDATSLTDTYALISGVINPGGSAANYEFEWGETTAYGETTPVTSAGNGTADVPVDYSLDSLKPRTRYHFRIVATNADGSTRVVGADQSFKTSRALAVSITGHTAKVVKGKAGFTLKAVGPVDTTAQGIATVKAVIGKQAQTITALPYTLDTGTKKQFAVRLPAAVRKVLNTKGHSKVVLRVLAKTTGIKGTVTKNLKVVG